MMFAMPAGLGLIPDWQFSTDPRINISINPHVQIPTDWPMGQRTVQPIGYVSQRTHGDPLAATNGLGIPMAFWQQPRADLRGLELFDSWAWRNRKPLVIVGIGLLGLAAFAGVGALLR